MILTTFSMKTMLFFLLLLSSISKNCDSAIFKTRFLSRLFSNHCFEFQLSFFSFSFSSSKTTIAIRSFFEFKTFVIFCVKSSFEKKRKKFETFLKKSLRLKIDFANLKFRLKFNFNCLSIQSTLNFLLNFQCNFDEFFHA